MKFEVSYTKKNGERVEGQIYTTESIGRCLVNLEEWGAKNIIVVSIERED